MTAILGDATIIDSGVDWLTVTTSDTEKGEKLIGIGEELCSGLSDSGSLLKKTGFQGYTGYGAESVFYGTRPDGVCLRVSGSIAHQTATAIALVQPNVTRIDLQITARRGTDDAEHARRIIDQYRAESTGTDGRTQRATQLIDSGSTGSTVMVGKRTAAWYGRYYDKSRETAGRYPPGTWRVESECKRRLATPVFERLAEYSFDRGAIASMVRSQWRRAGIHVHMRDNWELESPIVPRVTSDVERKLAWLRKVASKVYRELYEAGYQDEAANAMFDWLAPD
jgi:DNA relaxase NicK